MSRYILFSNTYNFRHDKYDFVTTDGTRFSCNSPHVYHSILSHKNGFIYLETNQYGGITSLLSKLNSNDPSVLDVWTSEKWLNGQVDIFGQQFNQTIRMLPVHSIRNGTFNRWDAIIDTAPRF